ncbi:hypothetical protein FQN51_000132 [Onygenales sp. PD_10]|nr:hypothetical protein FQN51_000132 [Onygenales sp. PD_10]
MSVPKSPFRKFPKLNVPKQPSLFIGFNPENIFSYRAFRHIEPKSLSPLYFKLRDQFNQREKDVLWWNVMTHAEANKRFSKVVRSWMARRTRNAFGHALMQFGYDQDGKRQLQPAADGSGMQTQTQTRPQDQELPERLVGTLELQVRAMGRIREYERLVDDCGLVVESIIRYQKALEQQKGGGWSPGKSSHRRGNP